MQFQILSKNDGWNVVPLSGAFSGRIVATVDGLNLHNVKFAGKTIVGSIKALWGITVMYEEVYSDMETLRALSIGGTFDTSLEEKLVLDFDGYLDVAGRVCKSAKKLLAIGSQIYAKGAK
jgi:hypothetical protein